MKNCSWIKGKFDPCNEMKLNQNLFEVFPKAAYKKGDKGEMILIEKCPFCNKTLIDIETIEAEMRTSREFQIRNLKGRDGCYYYIEFPIDTNLDQIRLGIIDFMNTKKLKYEDYYHYLSFVSPFLNSKKIRVVEWNIKTGKTKYNGIKGTIFMDGVKLALEWDIKRRKR